MPVMRPNEINEEERDMIEILLYNGYYEVEIENIQINAQILRKAIRRN